MDFNRSESSPTNAEIASKLNAIADILDGQGANPYRVKAYRSAAARIQDWNEPMAELLAREGRAGIQRLPNIGKTLAAAVEQLLQTGRSMLLDQIQGTVRPERILTTVAGIGPKTAWRIREALGIESLADLEAAAYDGRLASLPGLGQKKLRTIQESLAGRLRPRLKVPVSKCPKGAALPSVADLLEIDEEYRRKATSGQLPTTVPRRFNRLHQASLPLLHTQRTERRYTAMYSNSARAHEFAADHDWVVIIGPNHAGPWTVITSQFGPLKGLRIVRGREAECRRFYDRTEGLPAKPRAADRTAGGAETTADPLVEYADPFEPSEQQPESH